MKPHLQTEASAAAGGSARCALCPHRCILEAGKTGVCKVRQASAGLPRRAEPPAVQAGPSTGLYGSADVFYGFITALALDPIEKKPLYHWRPGSHIFSAGFTGCNLRCPFCQNWRISQAANTQGRRLSPEKLVKEAAETRCGQIAYTYSEPLVHHEYLLDCMKKARRGGIANVLVSNGCINEDPSEEILSLTDAANIDLKSFSEETYSAVLGGNLETVKNFIVKAVSKGIHVEITTLIVPGLNDDEKELDAAAAFIAELAPDGQAAVPWHLSAYHPDWKWNAPPTAPESLAAAAIRAKNKYPRLRHIYIGNAAPPPEFRDTICSHCGAVLVRRRGYTVDSGGLRKNGACRCVSCGEIAPFR